MWARHIEAVIGLWISVSWLIFRYTEAENYLIANDWITAILIFLFSLLTYNDRFRYLHLCNFLVGLWLISLVFVTGTGVDYAPHQNYMVAGLLLLMLSIIPSRTTEPPKDWIEFLSKKDKMKE